MMLTYKYRVKDATSGKYLNRHARAVNYVWNYCCEIQREAQRRWRAGMQSCWPTAFDLIKLCTGTAADLGLHSDTVQTVPAVHCVARCQARMPSVPGQFRSAPQTWMDCVYPTCLEGGWLDGRLPQTQVLLLDVAGD